MKQWYALYVILCSYGLVMPNGSTDLDQQWLKYCNGLLPDSTKSSNRTNVDISLRYVLWHSRDFNHLKVISQPGRKLLFCVISVKTIVLKLLPHHLPRSNELNPNHTKQSTGPGKWPLGMRPGSKFYSPGTRHLSPHHPRLPVISGQLRSWSVKSTVDRPTVKFSVTRYSTSFPILFS